MSASTRAADLFAAATDLLIAGAAPGPAGAAVPDELELAVRLRATATGGIPDPAFIEGLRAQLRPHPTSAADPAVRYALLDTPLGRLAVAYRDGRIVYCSAVAVDEVATAGFERAVARALGARPEPEPAAPAAIVRGVRDHLAGRRRFTSIDLSWLPPFQQRVLAKTAEIPRGEVRPYGWVAREIGAPGAVRAVGTALGHNPIPFIVPCHRVVRADGSLGEYSGGGPAVKERVLAYEQAPVAALTAAARRGERFRGSRTTHIVCYPSCHAARRIREENAVAFTSLVEARAQGYRPCERCRPA